MAPFIVPHAGPSAFTVVVETPSTTIRVPARDAQAAFQAAWFQATGHAGNAYAVTVRIEGPGSPLPVLVIPARDTWPDVEPAPWELEPEPLEIEEDEAVYACGCAPVAALALPW